MTQGQGNCLVCGRITGLQCVDCGENVCAEHMTYDGMCDGCSGDWEAEDER